jgi:NADH:ubiquinone reductase (H+-translocating)
VAAAGAKPHRVVVVGGGFGGLSAVRALARANVEVTLIDRRNFHLFQPLAYQAATGALAPAEIAPPLRSVFKRQKNARVLLGEVVDFDLERREVIACCFPNGEMRTHLPYDTLIVGGGSQYSYFGHDEWRPNAPELKSLEGALDIRSRILSAFEAAEVESDPAERKAWLTFVVAGAGPTGVEMAGQIAELARDTLHGDFRAIDTRQATVLLVEMADRVLTAFPESLSRKAARSLEELGVTLLLGHAVVDVDAGSVSVQAGGEDVQRIGAHTTIWAAGVTASGLARALASGAGAEVDRAGRITVEGDLTLPGHPEAFAIGDMVRVRGADGSITALPGLAPVAMQQGRYVAKVIQRRLEAKGSRSFRYRDKGNLATIGRSKAVAEIGPIRIGGSVAWLLWLGVHIFYLIGFENRVLVLLRWSVSFFTHGRGARLITENVPGGGRRPTADRVGQSPP